MLRIGFEYKDEILLTNIVKIFFDGGSRGNPGPAAGAAFADYEGGRERVCFMESATNNEAEYRGLLMAIELARELGLTQVQFLGDSKLVVMQVTGEWQAKHAMMSELRMQVLKALQSVPRWQIQWIPREQNAEADRIANEEMDRQLGVERISVVGSIPAPPSAGDAEIPSAASIAKLNKLGAKAGFGDLRKLKVGGTDAFSRISLEKLSQTLAGFANLEQAFLSTLNSDVLTKDLSEDARKKLLLQALRWAARGLQSDLPLRKVLVDLEMANSMRDKRK